MGTARFILFESLSGCISDSTDIITVKYQTSGILTGDNIVVYCETSSAIPATGGVWDNNNPGIAVINNAVIITAAGQGRRLFTYTPLEVAPSDPVGPVIVNGKR